MSDPRTTSLGHRIRDLRTRLGLSQRALGAKCRPPIRREHISHYETGQPPGLKILARIARALGTTLPALLTGVDIPPDRKAAA